MTAIPLAHTLEHPQAGSLPACLTGSASTRLLVELAHDFGSPLTAILTLAVSMQSGMSGSLTPGQHRQLSLIYAAALQLYATTSDTLELARGGEGTAPARRPFMLGTILEEVRTVVLPMAEEQGIGISLDCPTPVACRGDERALRRVLLNLTTNGIKVTKRGTVTLSARIEPAGRVTFDVADQGPGMRPETLRDLWQPFHKTAQDPRPRFSSTGLGLAICRKLVGELGGELSIRTKLGVGSRFGFTVPLSAAGA
ncbi:MAG: HAMP domain-containing histidine kinase [Actinomycetota bacterium]|nr:HAMP domain-containing histidine kinase [Actinomycetota bacterium]